jgi:hypothetical protein
VLCVENEIARYIPLPNLGSKDENCHISADCYYIATDDRLGAKPTLRSVTSTDCMYHELCVMQTTLPAVGFNFYRRFFSYQTTALFYF